MTYCAENVLDIRNGNHVSHTHHTQTHEKTPCKDYDPLKWNFGTSVQKEHDFRCCAYIQKIRSYDNPTTWSHKFWVGRYHMCIYTYMYVHIHVYNIIELYLYGNKYNTFRLLEAINLPVTESVLDTTLRNWQLWKVGDLSQFSHNFRKDCSNIHKPVGMKFPHPHPYVHL